jgi:hypothetical protein
VKLHQKTEVWKDNNVAGNDNTLQKTIEVIVADCYRNLDESDESPNVLNEARMFEVQLTLLASPLFCPSTTVWLDAVPQVLFSITLIEQRREVSLEIFVDELIEKLLLLVQPNGMVQWFLAHFRKVALMTFTTY